MKYLNNFDTFNPINEDKDGDYKPSHYTDDDDAFQRKMRMKQIKKNIGKPLPTSTKHNSINLKPYSPIKPDDMPLDKYLQSVKDKEEKKRQQNLPIPNFSLKEVKEEIKKYTTKTEFIQNSPLYYKWIVKHEKENLLFYYNRLKEKETEKNRKLKEIEAEKNRKLKEKETEKNRKLKEKENQKIYNLIYKTIDKCNTLDEFKHNYPELSQLLTMNIKYLDETKLKKFFSFLNGRIYTKTKFTEILEKMSGFRYYSNFALLYPKDAQWLYETKYQRDIYSLKNDINTYINIQTTNEIVSNNIQMTDEEFQYVIDNTKNCTKEKMNNIFVPNINGERTNTEILKNIIYGIIINKIQLVDAQQQILYEIMEDNKILGLRRSPYPEINKNIFYTLEEAINKIPNRFKN
jgi:hypothetical protein